jgi:hypothetical protein
MPLAVQAVLGRYTFSIHAQCRTRGMVPRIDWAALHRGLSTSDGLGQNPLRCQHRSPLGLCANLDPSGCITIPDLMCVATINDVLEVFACNGEWKHEKFSHGRLYLGGLYPCSDDPPGPMAILHFSTPSRITDDITTRSWSFGYIMPNGWTRCVVNFIP